MHKLQILSIPEHDELATRACMRKPNGTAQLLVAFCKLLLVLVPDCSEMPQMGMAGCLLPSSICFG